MSESQVTAVASAVTHKELTAKSTGNRFVLYTVETDKGEFTTAKRDLAADANRLLGRPAIYTVKTEQRGNFTNYYLEGVIGLTQSIPDDPEPQFVNGQAKTVEPIGTKTVEPIGTPTQPTNNDMAIYRQVAAKVAANLSTTSDEFWLNLDDLVTYFSTGQKPNGAPDMSGGFVADKSEYPLTQNSESAPAHTDDDIPF